MHHPSTYWLAFVQNLVNKKEEDHTKRSLIFVTGAHTPQCPECKNCHPAFHRKSSTHNQCTYQSWNALALMGPECQDIPMAAQMCHPSLHTIGFQSLHFKAKTQPSVPTWFGPSTQHNFDPSAFRVRSFYFYHAWAIAFCWFQREERCSFKFSVAHHVQTSLPELLLNVVNDNCVSCPRENQMVTILVLKRK